MLWYGLGLYWLLVKNNEIISPNIPSLDTFWDKNSNNMLHEYYDKISNEG